MFYNRKEYILKYDGINLLISEPVNWEADDKKYVRNEELHGIDVTHSGSLDFTGDAKSFLEYALDKGGVNAKVMLIKKIKNDDEEWIYDYIAWIDYSTYKITQTAFEVKLNADPLTTRYKSKRTVKVEIEGEETLSGKYIEEPLLVNTLYIEGRDIEEVAKLASPEEGAILDMRIDYANLGTRVMPLHLVETGDQDAGPVEIHSVVDLPSHGRTDTEVGLVGENIFGANETAATVIYKLNFNHKQSCNWTAFQLTSWSLQCRIVVYSYSAFTFTRIPSRDVILYERSGVGAVGSTFDYPQTIDISTGDFELALGPNQAASIQWYLEANGAGNWYVYWSQKWGLSCSGLLTFGMPYNTVCKYWDYTEGVFKNSYYESSIVVKEDTASLPTSSNMLMAHEVGKRLSRNVLDAEFKSTLLGRKEIDSELYTENGAFSETGFVHGMWLRGLTKTVSPDTYKPIVMSISDYFKTINTLYPCGIGLEGNTLRLEARDFFYQKIVAVDLGIINSANFTIEPDITALVSLVTISYGKEREYEDDSGLDEFNRKTQYSTPIEIVDTELKLESKSRTDGYGAERIRRDNPEISVNKNFEDDNKDDDDNWIFDINRLDGETAWRISGWAKRFAKPPTGIYSQDTAMNVWYSPINVLWRNSRWLKSGFLKDLDGKLRFGYSDGNANISTQLIGDKEYKTEDGIPVSDMPRASHIGKIGNVIAPITYDQLNGTTNGIKNIYCLFRWEANSIKYSGHIMSADRNNGIGTLRVKLFS